MSLVYLLPYRMVQHVYFRTVGKSPSVSALALGGHNIYVSADTNAGDHNNCISFIVLAKYHLWIRRAYHWRRPCPTRPHGRRGRGLALTSWPTSTTTTGSTTTTLKPSRGGCSAARIGRPRAGRGSQRGGSSMGCSCLTHLRQHQIGLT